MNRPAQSGPDGSERRAPDCRINPRARQQVSTALCRRTCADVPYRTGLAGLARPRSCNAVSSGATGARDAAVERAAETGDRRIKRVDAERNAALSQRRAASVVKWLTNRGGIDASRLSPKGYGKDEPIDTNDTDEGRQRNRRVQFKILTTDSATNLKDGAP